MYLAKLISNTIVLKKLILGEQIPQSLPVHVEQVHLISLINTPMETCIN